MERTVRLPLVHRRIDLLYPGIGAALIWTALLILYASGIVFPSFGSTLWLALTGIALVSLVGVQSYAVVSGNRTEMQLRIADRVQHYHELLKQRAYQEWVKASPVRLEALSSGDTERNRSLENLYLARPSFETLTANDPDHSFTRDALSHLSAYPVLQPESAGRGLSLGEGLKSPLKSVSDLVEGLGKYTEDHNARVLEFTNWEAQELKNMAKESSLKLNRDDDVVVLPPESVSLANLLKHLEDQSQEDSRKLEAVSHEDSDEWDLLSLKAGATQGDTDGFSVARSSSPDKLKDFKKLVTAFSRQRAKRLSSLNESISFFEQALVQTRLNLQIIINDIESGTLAGKCGTEGRLAIRERLDKEGGKGIQGDERRHWYVDFRNDDGKVRQQEISPKEVPYYQFLIGKRKSYLCPECSTEFRSLKGLCPKCGTQARSIKEVTVTST
jgi:hypothetical protein